MFLVQQCTLLPFKVKRIALHHLQLAIRGNEEFNTLITSTVAGGGVILHIYKSFDNKTSLFEKVEAKRRKEDKGLLAAKSELKEMTQRHSVVFVLLQHCTLHPFKVKCITPGHLQLAIRGNAEVINTLFKGTITTGGVILHIYKSLINTTKLL
ncbi:hypothetical protein PR202_gb06475 [Eleusine coracana subsp. coracana]|uniref:Histone H2A n=1 Tax=Eleusine coracana subsp. coracana TaxID=191504 RepID=A0AAV5E9K6_ELECO|nr:hypothetical protein PR202_gb06475 [Eleusine coracana subsp. coracana]